MYTKLKEDHKMLKNKNPLAELKRRAYKVSFSETPEKEAKILFDFKKFLRQAKEVKKTFSNEDLIRFRINLDS